MGSLSTRWKICIKNKELLTQIKVQVSENTDKTEVEMNLNLNQVLDYNHRQN
eukprot:UN14412